MAGEEYQSMAKFVATWDATEKERQSLELKRQTEADLNRAGEKVERCHQRYRQLVADLRGRRFRTVRKRYVCNKRVCG